MEETVAAEKSKTSTGDKIKESLLRRKYVVPFLLACVILACNQLTGINSIIGYNATILIQAGLSDLHAHLANTLFTLINVIATFGAVLLVDRKGRKFLLTLGSAGIIVSLLCVGILFHKTESKRVDAKDSVQALVTTNQTLTLAFNETALTNFTGGVLPSSLVIIYSYGDFYGATTAIRSDDQTAKPVEITRESLVPTNRFAVFMSHPFANFAAATNAPLKIENALITPVPDERNGWLTAICLFVFMSFFAVGPGVCVWLALSELMPTRIRSNGMSIALLINQAVSTTIAAIFLPTVGKYGYSTMFFAFAGFTVIYFVTAAFFLPETKGKTLEEIEEHFEGRK